MLPLTWYWFNIKYINTWQPNIVIAKYMKYNIKEIWLELPLQNTTFSNHYYNIYEWWQQADSDMNEQLRLPEAGSFNISTAVCIGLTILSIQIGPTKHETHWCIHRCTIRAGALHTSCMCSQIVQCNIRLTLCVKPQVLHRQYNLECNYIDG